MKELRSVLVATGVLGLHAKEREIAMSCRINTPYKIIIDKNRELINWCLYHSLGDPEKTPQQGHPNEEDIGTEYTHALKLGESDGSFIKYLP